VFADRRKDPDGGQEGNHGSAPAGGVGTSTANEALFDARLNRRSQAISCHSRNSPAHAAIVECCSGTRVVRHDPARLRHGQGRAGRFQFELRVYGRGGEKCRNCGKKLVMTHEIDKRQTVSVGNVSGNERAQWRQRQQCDPCRPCRLGALSLQMPTVFSALSVNCSGLPR